MLDVILIITQQSKKKETLITVFVYLLKFNVKEKSDCEIKTDVSFKDEGVIKEEFNRKVERES